MMDIPKLQPQPSDELPESAEQKLRAELESPDERRLRAELALQKLKELADNMAGQSRRREENYRKIFGAMPEDSKDKIVWRGIAAFANLNFADAADLKTLLKTPELRHFLNLLMFCAPSGTFDQTDIDFLQSCAEIREYTKLWWSASFPDVTTMPPIPEGAADVYSFNLLCRDYQPRLKRLLTWLCEPQKHPDLASEAINFLGKYASGVTVRPDDAMANFDETSSDYCPVYYSKSVDYKLLMGPVCKFIFDRIERYHDWLDRIAPEGKKFKQSADEDEETEREKAVPIRICDRPGCGKFFVPRRIGRKKFCSDACVRLAQTPRSGDENRDYMRVYRLEKDSRAVLRKKLKPPIMREQLDTIAKDWPDLAGRVKTLKKRAGI